MRLMGKGTGGDLGYGLPWNYVGELRNTWSPERFRRVRSWDRIIANFMRADYCSCRKPLTVARGAVEPGIGATAAGEDELLTYLRAQ